MDASGLAGERRTRWTAVSARGISQGSPDDSDDWGNDESGGEARELLTAQRFITCI